MFKLRIDPHNLAQTIMDLVDEGIETLELSHHEARERAENVWVNVCGGVWQAGGQVIVDPPIDLIPIEKKEESEE